MEAKIGIWWGLQQLHEGEQIDLCNMSNVQRIILTKDMRYVIVSSYKVARQASEQKFGGAEYILSREEAIRRFPKLFFKSSDAYKKSSENFNTIAFNFKPDVADYIRTKKNMTAYITALVNAERSGMIKIE